MNNASPSFIDTLSAYRERVQSSLKNAIFAANNVSPLLCEAMGYASLNGGKRLRPILVYATGECFGQSRDALDSIATAIECIHCFSLIHDDLPAMDDDHLRRGKPTCHIVYGEATAILAGDALQALAFDLLSSLPHTDISARIQLKIIKTLAHHSGPSGMVAGQSLDLSAEGKKIAAIDLEHIHHLKTGALIRASVIMGALGAGCDDPKTIDAFDQFATRLGLAFQLQDDLLDITGNSENLGKNTGQDAKLEKATYAILFGIKHTRNQIEKLMTEAISILQSLPQDTSMLQQLCEYLVHRER
jgi:farnesyl diphosphate synthase